jgi:hypothetical protein
MPPPPPLPFNERHAKAARLAARTRNFFDGWVQAQEREAEGIEARAYFTALLAHVAALFETRRDTINLPTLAQDAELKEQLDHAMALARRVNNLRNDDFSNRVDLATFADAFKRAQVGPDEIDELLGLAQSIIDRLAPPPA